MRLHICRILDSLRKTIALGTLAATEMRFTAKLAHGILFTVLMWICCVPASAYMLDELIIDYRQQIMQTKDAQATAIGHILTGTVPNENIVSHFESLLLATRQSRAAFKPKVLGGDALPAIWETWDDFLAKLDRAEDNISVAIETIRNTGPEAAGGVAIAALACKDCHDTYRKK